jgi:large subunit ribosomal protein L35
MPKMKSKKAASKRFKVSANGKVKFKKAGKRHNLGHRKSAKRKLKLRSGDYLHKSSVKRIITSLPYDMH